MVPDFAAVVAAVGLQPGLELLLLQAAQPEPVPEVRIPLHGPPLRHHDHLPLAASPGGCAVDARAGLGCTVICLEPQRVEKQQSGDA